LPSFSRDAFGDSGDSSTHIATTRLRTIIADRRIPGRIPNSRMIF
jgi:hypothetical protein